MTKPLRIVLTPGEPAGIGPDIVIRIAQLNWPAELIVVADPDLLKQRAKQLHLPLSLCEPNLNEPAKIHRNGVLPIIPISLAAEITTGKLNPKNAPYVIETLKIAADLCLQKKVHALVTGPVHKGVLNEAGFTFSGHTEFLAQLAQIDHTVMLFVIEHDMNASHQIKNSSTQHSRCLRVALLTTHIPLANVSQAITQDKLERTLTILHHDLRTKFHIDTPRILVCGVNPHAGEGGYLGREEIDILTPVISRWQKMGHLIEGPLPADTLFTPRHLQHTDAVLAMYHDQALPLVKYLGFGHAVNVTLGLPFIRTSVDHGTALDIAGTDAVDTGSLIAAINLALKI